MSSGEKYSTFSLSMKYVDAHFLPLLLEAWVRRNPTLVGRVNSDTARTPSAGAATAPPDAAPPGPTRGAGGGGVDDRMSTATTEL